MTDQIRRIFIVDDEVLVAMDMSDLLERMGFQIVGPAVHQEQALTIARTEPMDAAFLDVNLGENKTSQPIAEILRDRCVPFIFVTAYTADEVTFRLSDERVLKKPVTSSEMLASLRAVLPDREDKGS